MKLTDAEIRGIVHNVPSIKRQLAREERIAINNVIQVSESYQDPPQSRLRMEWGMWPKTSTKKSMCPVVPRTKESILCNNTDYLKNLVKDK